MEESAALDHSAALALKEQVDEERGVIEKEASIAGKRPREEGGGDGRRHWASGWRYSYIHSYRLVHHRAQSTHARRSRFHGRLIHLLAHAMHHVRRPSRQGWARAARMDAARGWRRG